MSEEKEEALRQISEIKHHLIDKQTFFPYNYNATYIWAVIAAIMTFFIIPMYEISVLQGSVISLILITIGFVIEGSMTKKVNESYDIEDCTLRQQFIMKSFVMMSFFLIAISAIFASYKLYAPMLLTWLFMISLGYFSVGFVLNIKRFLQMSSFNMFSAVVLLAIGYISHRVEGTTGIYLVSVQLFLVLGLTIMPSIIAWQQIKEEK
jgi:uncharacterized membrane protein